MTVVELEKQMLPGFDAEIAEELRRSFVKRGVTVMLGHGYKSMAAEGRAMDGRRSTPRAQQKRSTPRPCWSRWDVSR